jgi:hypothetical protein
MDEKVMEQITASTERLVAAAQALQQTLATISAQQQEINAKIDRIVAAIEDKPAVMEANGSTPAKETRMGYPKARKTLSPLVTMILAKSGVDDVSDSGVLDKALGSLTPEQRIAVKTEMARAGIIE